INSYRLLLEWWHGGCRNQLLSSATTNTLKVAAGFDGIKDSEIQNSVDILSGPVIDETIFTLPGESEYHNHLFNLFKAEFYWDSSPSETPITRIQHCRQKGAIIAACQRLAYSFDPDATVDQVNQSTTIRSHAIPPPP